MKATKILLAGGLTELGTGLSFVIVHDALATDHTFDWWEFGVSSDAPALIAFLAGMATRSTVLFLLAVTYRTRSCSCTGLRFGGPKLDVERLSGAMNELGSEMSWPIYELRNP